jgi:hypothetical protein
VIDSVFRSIRIYAKDPSNRPRNGEISSRPLRHSSNMTGDILSASSAEQRPELQKIIFDMVTVYRPRRELQKAAPRNFDAFFEPVYFEKQKKTVAIPAVRALTLYLVFCSAPFAIPGFSRAIPLLHCRNQAAETKGRIRHDDQQHKTHRRAKRPLPQMGVR